MAYSKLCPSKKPVCPSDSTKKSGGSSGSKKLPDFKRAKKSGLVRLGFLPDEWFTFFHSQTGVSGPYVFGIVLVNYMLSKEIFIMEHEYYSGLSIALIVWLVTTKLGPAAGASLDKEVDAIVADWQKGRDDEIASYESQIKAAKDAQWRAEGQKSLMDAKKENIMMQLEAAYRERMMHVYSSVKGRMEYQVKKHRSEGRIHQKWMIKWILENVRKSITPNFEKQALNSAIQELSSAAGRA
ncbi:ATP synthase b [Operophtera brumata]|uniref:ATP synthase subunit b n=1 Tax=Operophtera brumata TaxID=104452 RepID=A0A0L7LU08_OPEBR|nr:ATP synthase b [Operophtera brumata]